MTQRRFLPDRPQDLDAIMPGEMEIQHDDARMSLIAVFPPNMDELKRPLPVGDDFNFDIFVKAGKGHTKDVGIGRAVVNNQDFGLRQGVLLVL